MKAYTGIWRIRAVTELQYRGAAFSGVITQFFFGLLLIMVYEAFANSSNINTVPFAVTATYVWLQQAFLRLGSGVNGDIYASIASGGISYDLCRPLHPYMYWYVRDIAQRIVSVALRAGCMIPIALLLPSPYRMMPPVSSAALGLALLSLCLGTLLANSLAEILNAVTMRTLDGRGPSNIYYALTAFFTGILVPLPLFPKGWQKVMRALPFAHIIDTPIRIYTGEQPVSTVLALLLTQLIWILALIAIGLLAWRANMKRLVVQGG